jgi:hypothetical protein
MECHGHTQKPQTYNDQIREKQTDQDIANYIKEQSGLTSTYASNEEAELRGP